MTDNEIIKALQELGRYNGLQRKYTIAIHNVLYLLNHQKAEVAPRKEEGKEMFI